MSLTLKEAVRREPGIMGLFARRPRLVWSGREGWHLGARLGVTRDEARERWRAVEHLLLHEDAEANDREYRLGLSWAWVPSYTSDPKVPLYRPETLEEFKLRVTPSSPLDQVIRWIGFDGQEVDHGHLDEEISQARFIDQADVSAALRLLRAEEWLREKRTGRRVSVTLFDFKGGRDISLDAPSQADLGGPRRAA